jgi:hypothetical protein
MKLRNKREVVQSSTPWVTILVIILATLKLTGLIEITWFGVFLPAILYGAVILGLLFVIFIIAVIITVYEKLKD